MKVVEKWRCMRCDEHGEGPGSDKAAEKHVKETLHPTCSFSVPA